MEKSEYIWKNGEFVPWDEAQVHAVSYTHLRAHET